MRDKVVVLVAGGRMVQTGQQAALTDEELAAQLTDELKDSAVFQQWSVQPVSNYTLRMCSEIIDMAAGYINREGAKGVVITCALEGLAELAYLADLIWALNPPVVFTGSIFNAGSRRSETALRLTQAVKSAMSGSCTGKGALVCLNDALYSPADIIRISGCASANIFAFPDAPLAVFTQPLDELVQIRQPRRRQVQSLKLPLARNIEIIDAALGSSDLILKALLDKRFDELEGLIVSGFGDGDVPSSWMPLLRKLVRLNIPVVLAARDPGGLVQDIEDYEGSSSQLLEAGLISAGMLTPHQARIRLAVALAAGLDGDDLKSYMRGGV
ncbi:MAG: asparaginase [Synergistaceae bacterium]|nr:asparaginase [Synergistaceae bacterium]